MKITDIEVWKVHMPLKRPYMTTYGYTTETENVFLRLETDTGLNAYGCAAPEPPATGETPDSVLAACHSVIIPMLLSQDPLRRALWLQKLSRLLPGQPTARALIDMAFFDLMGKLAGLPLYKILGGFRDAIPTSITIGIKPVRETLEEAAEYLEMGFKALKIKGGHDVETDIERIIKIRERAGRETTLHFDANQGYTVEQCRRFFEGVRHTALAFVEQPIPRQFPDMWNRIIPLVHFPLMADESFMDIQDMLWFAQQNMWLLFNVKLMKCGGIGPALAIEMFAAARDTGLMVGCMDEAALAISAGLHFALASPQILWADLDGHFDLLSDPSAGTVIFKDGCLFPSEKPGLGWK